jgi:hypothetical protein
MDKKGNNPNNEKKSESLANISSEDFFKLRGKLKFKDLDCTIDEFKNQLFAEIERKMNQPAGFKNE